MSKGAYVKPEEGKLFIQLRKEGKSYKEIQNLTGRSWQTIKNWMYNNVEYKDRLKGGTVINYPEHCTSKTTVETDINIPTPKTLIEDHEPVMEKTLNDFTPREIIKNMYERGYRIENGELVCIVKQRVNLKDIINA